MTPTAPQAISQRTRDAKLHSSPMRSNFIGTSTRRGSAWFPSDRPPMPADRDDNESGPHTDIPVPAVDQKKLLCQETHRAGIGLYTGILQTLGCSFPDEGLVGDDGNIPK